MLKQLFNRYTGIRIWSPFSLVLVVASATILSGLVLLIAAWLTPLPMRLLVPPSRVVRFSDRSTGFVFLSPDEKWRIDAQSSDIDPNYIKALLAYEDRRFNLHPGIDPFAVVRAVIQNFSRRKVVSGASTLTMQLVRVLEPRPRSVRSKFIEAFRSLQMELRFSKAEILSAYMTFISFGKNIEGVETASWAYFGHGAKNLTPAEIAVLLSVPQLPARRYPHPKHTSALKVARDKILRILYARQIFAADRESLDSSLLAPVPAALKPFPRDAAHLAFWLDQDRGLKVGQNGDILTTIDPAVQKLVTHLSDREGRQAANNGVHNHAIVVIENSTGEVKGIIGGIDFWNRRPGSQIAGFQIARSPGSLLKPFIYAQALDLGLILPERLVPDVPRDFGGYAPKNYDGQFNGLIKIEYALARSLNIPFVNLLEKIGIERFLGTIGQTGISRILKSPGYYGLSVAAGGIELNALEIAGLYATLARGGRFIPVNWIASDGRKSDKQEMQIFSAGAAWMTRKALRVRDRPDFPRRRDFAQVPAGVFWKTGTSFGHRDAWAAGSAGKYTGVVWFGNVDYAPSHALVGSDMAAPLLFDILEGLVDPMQVEEDFQPQLVTNIEVCAFSGYLPGHACPRKRLGHALVHHIPGEECPFHTEMEIDKATGLAVGPMCRAGRETERRKFMVWPAGVRRYLGSSNRHLPDLPKIHPSCTHIAKQDGLRIVSPAKNKIMFLIPGLDPGKQEIPFEVDAEHSTDQVSWFLDGKFLKTSNADEQVWWTPEPGEHELTVVGMSGQSSRRKFKVRSF